MGAPANRDFFFCNIPQKLKTRVVKKSVNPEWDEELTLSIEDPAVPIRLVCVRFHPSLLSQIACLGSYHPTLSNVYKYSEQKARKEKHFTASINLLPGFLGMRTEHSLPIFPTVGQDNQVSPHILVVISYANSA